MNAVETVGMIHKHHFLARSNERQQTMQCKEVALVLELVCIRYTSPEISKLFLNHHSYSFILKCISSEVHKQDTIEVDCSNCIISRCIHKKLCKTNSCKTLKRVYAG